MRVAGRLQGNTGSASGGRQPWLNACAPARAPLNVLARLARPARKSQWHRLCSHTQTRGVAVSYPLRCAQAACIREHILAHAPAARRPGLAGADDAPPRSQPPTNRPLPPTHAPCHVGARQRQGRGPKDLQVEQSRCARGRPPPPPARQPRARAAAHARLRMRSAVASQHSPALQPRSSLARAAPLHLTPSHHSAAPHPN